MYVFCVSFCAVRNYFGECLCFTEKQTKDRKSQTEWGSSINETAGVKLTQEICSHLHDTHYSSVFKVNPQKVGPASNE